MGVLKKSEINSLFFFLRPISFLYPFYVLLSFSYNLLVYYLKKDIKKNKKIKKKKKKNL